MVYFDGERIKHVAKEKGWTNNDIAKAIGTSSERVRGWVICRSAPNGHEVASLANVFGVDVGYFFPALKK